MIKFLNKISLNTTANDFINSNPYTYYVYDTKTYLSSIGHWPTWKDIGGAIKNGFEYVGRYVKQMVLSNYAEDVTLLGTIGQIGLGVLGFDIHLNILDITYDFDKWEWSWGHAGQTVLDLAAVLPIVGLLKYTDEVGTLIKAVNKSGDMVKDIEKSKDIYKSIKKADPSKVINTLANFKSRKITFGNNTFLLDKSAMKHILERHHIEYGGLI